MHRTVLELPRAPINPASRAFCERKYEYYEVLREQAPVYRGRLAIIKFHLLSRYDDCLALLKDPRFVRNRTTATGGGRMPFPMPKSLALLSESLIVEDDPAHRRLRNLVSKAFTPHAIDRLSTRIESLTHELLDRAEKKGTVDLQSSYCLPIPVTVISELVGLDPRDMPEFQRIMNVLTKGFSGWTLFRSLFWDLRGAIRMMRTLIAKKRTHPGEDILTGLIHAEEEGDSLSEDELLSFVFLLVVAGYETTVHLITNGVVALLDHPEQLARLREQPELMGTAVEEVIRYRGSVQGTKLNYATENVRLHGVEIPRGTAVIPLLGAANHDPRAFEHPERFDIARSPNKHLGLGFGAHFCLGAQLARMETKIALTTLLARYPDLRLAVDRDQLELVHMPFWHRYASLPVELR